MIADCLTTRRAWTAKQISNLNQQSATLWRDWRDLNSRSLHRQCSALEPTKLQPRRVFSIDDWRLAFLTLNLDRNRAIINRQSTMSLGGLTGLEPATAAVTEQCSTN